MKYQRCDSKIGGWDCSLCDEILRTRKELVEHKKIVHDKIYKKGEHGFYRKNVGGLCQFCHKPFRGLNLHEKHCEKNPVRIDGNWKGLKHSTESKLLIQQAAIKCQQEGRGHSIGQDRWKRLPSIPERWMMTVLQKECQDTQVIREMYFKPFVLDFAWPNKKLCIEIDGEQHYRDQVQMNRDKRKEALLKINGWKLLRLRWSEVMKDKQNYVIKIKQFIGDE